MMLVQCIYQISEQQFSLVLIGSRNSAISLAIHRFATGAKMASRFKTFSKDEANINKATNFGLSVFTGGQKIIFMLNLQQNRKNALDKIPEMF